MEEINMSKLRDNLQAMCDERVNGFFKKNKYCEIEGQRQVNQIAESIVQGARDIESRFRYVCSAFIFEKQKDLLHFCTDSLWDTARDSVISFKYNNQQVYCFVYLYCLYSDSVIPLSNKSIKSSAN